MELFKNEKEELEPGSHSPLAERMRPASLEEFAGQRHLLGPDKAVGRLLAGDRPASLIFLGTARNRQDHPGPHPGQTLAGRVRGVLRGAVRCGRHQKGGGPGQGAPAQGPAHRAFHRRNPPLQQGPAGCVVAPCRIRAGHVVRRHHRKPQLRGYPRAFEQASGAGVAALGPGGVEPYPGPGPARPRAWPGRPGDSAHRKGQGTPRRLGIRRRQAALGRAGGGGPYRAFGPGRGEDHRSGPGRGGGRQKRPCATTRPGTSTTTS